jgi:hypothetical protein
MNKANNCVIYCIDFRFHKSIEEWLSKEGFIGDTDFIVIAGASRDLVKPMEKFHKDAILREIEISVKLHDPDNIIFIDHQDCGGYSQDGTIPSGLPLKDDMELHHEYSKIAHEILKEIFPSKTIKTYYAELTGEIVPN